MLWQQIIVWVEELNELMAAAAGVDYESSKYDSLQIDLFRALRV